MVRTTELNENFSNYPDGDRDLRIYAIDDLGGAGYLGAVCVSDVS